MRNKRVLDFFDGGYFIQGDLTRYGALSASFSVATGVSVTEYKRPTHKSCHAILPTV